MNNKRNSEISLSNADEDTLRDIYECIYRIECRAWLLFLFLVVISIKCLLMEREAFIWENEVLAVTFISYSFYLSMWVVSPTKKLSTQLAKLASKNPNVKPRYDFIWSSAIDFLVPTLIPFLIFAIWLALRIAFHSC